MEHLKDIKDRLDNIDKTLIRNTLSLEEHIRRTNVLEQKMEPVEKHVLAMQSITKFILSGLAAGAAIAAITKIWL